MKIEFFRHIFENILISLTRVRRQRLKVRPYAEVFLRGLCVPWLQSWGCRSVVGCREWVKD